MLKLRLLLNRFKLPAVLFWSSAGLFLPRGVSLHVIVGKGIYAASGEPISVSQDLVEQTHLQYKQEILRMYNKHMSRTGSKPIKLD